MYVYGPSSSFMAIVAGEGSKSVDASLLLNLQIDLVHEINGRLCLSRIVCMELFSTSPRLTKTVGTHALISSESQQLNAEYCGVHRLPSALAAWIPEHIEIKR
jgi:hypothetical protein